MDRKLILIACADSILWPLIQLGVSYMAFRRKATSFDPQAWLYRERKWESGGRFYRRYLKIGRWKGKLPDGAALFPGAFQKKRLSEKDELYLRRFQVETCRGEWAHWVMLLFVPLFFPWNPPWASGVIAAYGILANVPCIWVQRHNRIVLGKILRNWRFSKIHVKTGP